MAIHLNSEGMAIEAIDENLAVAKYCLGTLKADNTGVYGYPATLLLFVVIDALSGYLGYARYSLGMLQMICPELSERQIKQLKSWFRNPIAHQAVIVPGTMISLQEGTPFEFVGGEPIHIRIPALYQLVEKAWKEFDRSKITLKFEAKLPSQGPVK